MQFVGEDDQEKDSSSSDAFCHFPAPRIVGFLGPFPTANFLQESPPGSELRVPVGSHAFYRCRSGRVTDARTNARGFALPCLGNRTFPDSGFVPECQVRNLPQTCFFC